MLADEILLKALEALGANQNSRVRARARNQIRKYLEEYAPDLLENVAAEGASEPALPLQPRPFDRAEGETEYSYVALREKLLAAENYHRLRPLDEREYFGKLRRYIAQNDDKEFRHTLWNAIRGFGSAAIRQRLEIIHPLSVFGHQLRQIQQGYR